jgi:FkbM family methyltransferase
VWLGFLMRRLPPALPGKARLARMILGDSLRYGSFLVKARSNTRFLVPSVAESIGFHLYVDGVYEPREVDWVLARLAPGDVFVDVGANIGVFTVMAARRVGPKGRVIAIEPSPSIFRYLDENVRLNGLDNVTLFQAALDEVPAEDVPFYEAPLESFGAGALSDVHGGEPVRVRSASLDSILTDLGISAVTVLKIDVEGFEQRVLKGSRALLCGPHSPAIVFEFYDWAESRAATPGDAQRLLKEWGYRLWTLETASAGAPPLSEVLTDGGGTLVASR